ncbi:carbon starvation protein A [Candidatus Omnitrophota bacterium]
MLSIILAFGVIILFVVMHLTYGRFLARKIYSIDNSHVTPSVALRDDADYVPTKVEIVFGHHFTSIAGTGPIVGPAIAVIWGWLPALLWIVVGSIVIGAVHDFGALVVSLRHEGKSIGEICASLISPRVRILFLVMIAVALLIVIAVFCLVIAILFTLYPQAVIPVWFQIPLAMVVGYLVYKKGMNSLPLSLVAVVILYAAIVVGAYFPITLSSIGNISALTIWTIILLVYAAIASILPVWQLLQPRDYINGHQLFIALGLLALGVIASRPELVAPVIDLKPEGAPPILPFLFITIACGAVSGFHSLVGSGTSSKQLEKESDALIVGYGGMLLEGVLAVFVLIAVAGGIGLAGGELGISGKAMWLERYASWSHASGLGAKVGAFVEGAAHMLARLGIPLKVGIGIMGVFVASFAGTTLDTATRLQRYVISELSNACKIKPLSNKWGATLCAVISAGILALAKEGGKGGLMLWPLFGATNQLLAAMALLTITVYLFKQKKPIIYTLIPMIFMIFITGWAMGTNLMAFYKEGPASLHLFVIGVLIALIEVWILIESWLAIRAFKNTSLIEKD